MENQPNKSRSHAVYSLKLHIVFVTKYRIKILTPELLDSLQGAFEDILSDWRGTLLEFGGEADHVHLLAEIHPALNISSLVANLKTASSKRARNRFSEHLNRPLDPRLAYSLRRGIRGQMFNFYWHVPNLSSTFFPKRIHKLSKTVEGYLMINYY